MINAHPIIFFFANYIYEILLSFWPNVGDFIMGIIY